MDRDPATPEADRDTPAAPRLPGFSGTLSAAAWGDAIRRFHLLGERLEALGDAVPVRPAALRTLQERVGAEARYPLALVEEDDTIRVVPLAVLLSNALDAMAEAGEPADAVRAGGDRIEAALGAAADARSRPPRLEEILPEAMSQVRGVLGESESAALDAGVAALTPRLPGEAILIGLRPDSFFHLHMLALHGRRAAARDSVRHEVQRLRQLMEGLLEADAGHARASGEALAASLGGRAANRLDPDALSRNLPDSRGPKRLDMERRARIEACLSTLRRWEEESVQDPHAFVIHDRALPENLDLPSARIMKDADPLAAAQNVFDGLADSVLDLARALRTARLEFAGEFDEERHGPALARLDWQALSAEELLAMPAVIAVQTGDRVQCRSLATLSELLRSGRPLQIVIIEPCSPHDDATAGESLAGHHRSLGDLALGHREAFVLQSTLARPDHLLEGLEQMSGTLDPAVALIAVPSWHSTMPPMIQVAAALEGRGTPCFRYDPRAGLSLAECFDARGNPEPRSLWPAQAGPGGDDGEATPGEAFTFAHAAACDPAHRAHFLVIPEAAWNDEQVEMAAYLEQSRHDVPHAVPYIGVVLADGTAGRAVVTRELAFACRDRMRAWRIVQEMAGEDSEYARRAAEDARRELRDEAAREKAALEERHAREIEETRQQAVSGAMENLARALVGGEHLAGAPSPAPAPAPPPDTTAGEAAAAEPEAAAAGPAAITEPCIDTPLCTSCNECTNINARLFKYDDNKQAYIADAAAGTYKELVKAAEKCPARCIHPGLPRDGDKTGTSAMIARAEPFN